MAFVTHTYSIAIEDGDGLEGGRPTVQTRWSPGAGNNGTRQTVTITASTFTALSPPSGAKAVALILGTATGLTLKGITGDTGTTLTPSSSPLGLDAILPLGATPSIGIASSNASNQTIEVLWL